MAEEEQSHEPQARDADEAPPQDATNEQTTREEGDLAPVIGPVDDELFGKRIRKCFGSREFWGTIVEAYVVNRGLFYKVSFDDGDVDILCAEEIHADLKETSLHSAKDPASEQRAQSASESSSLAKTTPYMDALRAKKASLKRRREEAPDLDERPAGPWDVRLWSTRLYASIMEVNGLIRIEDFVSMADGEKGELEATGKVKKGDALLAVQGRIVHGVVTHLQASNLIRSAPRPLTLTFFRPNLSASAVNVSDLTTKADPPISDTSASASTESGLKKSRPNTVDGVSGTTEGTTALTTGQRPSTPEIKIIQVVPPVEAPVQPLVPSRVIGTSSTHLRNERDRWGQAAARPIGHGGNSVSSFFQPRMTEPPVGQMAVPRTHHGTHALRTHPSDDHEREMHRQRQYPSSAFRGGYRYSSQAVHGQSLHPPPHGSAHTVKAPGHYVNAPISTQRNSHVHQQHVFDPASNTGPQTSHPSQCESMNRYQGSSSHPMVMMANRAERMHHPSGFINTRVPTHQHQHHPQHRQAAEYRPLSSRQEEIVTMDHYLSHIVPEEAANRNNTPVAAAPPMQPVPQLPVDQTTGAISRAPVIPRRESPAPVISSHASSREPSPSIVRSASAAPDEGTRFLRLDQLGETSDSLVDSVGSSFLSINEKSFVENLPSSSAVPNISSAIATGTRADAPPRPRSIYPQRPRYLSKINAGDIVEVVVTQPRLFMTLGITGSGNYVCVSSFVRGENGEIGEIEASGKVLPGDVLLGIGNVETPPYMPPGEVAKVVATLPRPYSVFFMRATWDML